MNNLFNFDVMFVDNPPKQESIIYLYVFIV